MRKQAITSTLTIFAISGTVAFVCGFILGTYAPPFGLEPVTVGIAFTMALWFGIVAAWAFDKE